MSQVLLDQTQTADVSIQHLQTLDPSKTPQKEAKPDTETSY